jgi:hypothetical protein
MVEGEAMRPAPAEVLYVEAPTIPAGITLDAYRHSRPRPPDRHGFLRVLGSRGERTGVRRSLLAERDALGASRE